MRLERKRVLILSVTRQSLGKTVIDQQPLTELAILPEINTIPLFRAIVARPWEYAYDIELRRTSNKSILNLSWPSEFDYNGMIKSRHMPLGFAAKIYVREGDVGRNGKKAFKEGWYFK